MHSSVSAATLPLPHLTLLPTGAGRSATPRRTPRYAERRHALLVAAILLGVVAVDALAGGPRPSLHSLAPHEPASPLAVLLRHAPSRDLGSDSTPAPLDAYLVTSPRDCATNLGALDLLAREIIAPRIRLAGVLVVNLSRQHRDNGGSPHDSAAITTVREAIAAHDLPVPPVRALDAPTSALLRRIGYRATPFLVVLDSAGSLRFATSSARSFSEYQNLARALAALASASR